LPIMPRVPMALNGGCANCGPSGKRATVRRTHGYRRQRMAKYGKMAQAKVKKTMDELKRGTLRSGSGRKVKSRKQAIAIGLSEARRAGGKVPKKP